MAERIGLALLARYLDGAASAEERAAVEAWIGTDPERRAAVAALQAAWRAEFERLHAPYDADAAWARLADHLRPAPAQEAAGRAAASGRSVPPAPDRRRWRPIPISTPPRRMARVVRWGALAAALVIAARVSGLLEPGNRRSPSVEQAAVPEMRTYAAARGQRAIIRLLDGSEVTLNVDSRLRIPATFGTVGRDVYLEGEAYFSVLHDTMQPFVVHTVRGTIRDLGTRFAVRAYSDERAEHVVVAEGAVSLVALPGLAGGGAGGRGGREGGGGTAVDSRGTARPGPGAAPRGPSPAVSLHAGEAATLSAERGVVVASRANVEAALAWTRGRLVFEGVTLDEAARQLGRWYDLDVEIADPALARRLVTGSYGDEPIAHVLTVITAAVGARYERRGRSVRIYPAGGAP
jgi:transmembrane sensor